MMAGEVVGGDRGNLTRLIGRRVHVHGEYGLEFTGILRYEHGSIVPFYVVTETEVSSADMGVRPAGAELALEDGDVVTPIPFGGDVPLP